MGNSKKSPRLTFLVLLLVAVVVYANMCEKAESLPKGQPTTTVSSKQASRANNLREAIPPRVVVVSAKQLDSLYYKDREKWEAIKLRPVEIRGVVFDKGDLRNPYIVLGAIPDGSSYRSGVARCWFNVGDPAVDYFQRGDSLILSGVLKGRELFHEVFGCQVVNAFR